MSRRKSKGGMMDCLPVCEVDPLGIGPAGLTCGGVDAGGGAGQALVIIPAIMVKWFDERQICPAVLAFVHEGTAPDLSGCGFYRAGLCGRMAGECCAFQEPDDAEIWCKAADWRALPGGGVVHRDLWPVYGWGVCHDRAEM
jgi:hypothetical protein